MTLALIDKTLPATSRGILEKIALVEARLRPREGTLQVRMEHRLHAGLYARTCRLAADQVITSVLIKIPTVLIVHGDCIVLAGDEWQELTGFNVLAAEAARKQIYVTRGETEITMIFRTEAKTVEEAEAEFTDEAANLLSRRTECQG
jgi:hypothetical protein